MDATATATAVPANGWLVDLSEAELKSLIGATVEVACNLRLDTGLLVKVADRAVHLYVLGSEEPRIYPISATRFTRLDVPVRPKLAQCLEEEFRWAEHKASLRDPESSTAASHDYDHALGGHEENIVGFYEGLLKETLHELLAPVTAG